VTELVREQPPRAWPRAARTARGQPAALLRRPRLPRRPARPPPVARN